MKEKITVTVPYAHGQWDVTLKKLEQREYKGKTYITYDVVDGSAKETRLSAEQLRANPAYKNCDIFANVPSRTIVFRCPKRAV